ncbi:T9SS type A sorting domain-containing protein [candidate division KSB1 bacterium]|nr:T9SS type A sorting domain-containing protein [candidate division KSB1 bacterium]
MRETHFILNSLRGIFLFCIILISLVTIMYQTTSAESTNNINKAASTFSDNFDDGNANGWTPLNSGHWSVVYDQGDYAYLLNTSDYGDYENDLLNEHSIITNYYFTDFEFSCNARTPEDMGQNDAADYDIIFGYQNNASYFRVMFNSKNNYSNIFKITNGQTDTVASCPGTILQDNNYHYIKIIRISGQISVAFDNTIIMTGYDSDFPTGKLGVGSFNDAAYFDDIYITSNPTSYSRSIAINKTSLTNSCTQGSNASSQTFAVWNAGTESMSYSIYASDIWVLCSPSSGYSSGDHDIIDVSYNTSGLSAGTHQTSITVSAATATNNPVVIPVTIHVNSAYPTLFSDDFQDGNADTWQPLNGYRWSVVQDQGDFSYFLNTSDYGDYEDDRLNEYSLITNHDFTNFDFTCQVRTPENLSVNDAADYDIIFGYQNDYNYYRVMFNSDINNTNVIKIADGQSETIASYAGRLIQDNNYHQIKISRLNFEIRVYYDGMFLMSGSNPTFPAGRIAIGSFNDAAYFDDIVIKTNVEPINYIHITSPNNGDEVWTIGQPYSILWTADPFVGNVKIAISLDNGINWETLFYYTDNDGFVEWTPSSEYNSDQCRLRITSLDYPDVYDINDLPFSIVGPGPQSFVYIAPWLPSGITPDIDGEINESFWLSIEADSLLHGGAVDSWNTPWTAWNDNLVTFKAAWSAETNMLYVAVNVVDDVRGIFDNIDPNAVNYWPWEDESIEFCIDGDNSGGSYDGRNDIAQQWRVSGLNIRNLINYPQPDEHGIYTGQDFVTAVKQGSQGNWACEAAFKIYNNMPSQRHTLSAGDIIGFDIWYNDSDNQNLQSPYYLRDHQTGWRYAGPAYLNADYMGDLILAPTLDQNPVLHVNPTVLDFGSSLTNLSFQISNTGSGDLYWVVNENPDKLWITSVTPTSGSNNATITVQVNRSLLTTDSDVGVISITSNGGNQNVFVQIANAEQISAPTTPTGPSLGKVQQRLSFSTGGAVSSLGHNLEYQFDWGDGTISSWGAPTQNKTYTTQGVMQIKAHARCQLHPNIVSDWTLPKTVTISYCNLSINISPVGSGTVTKSPSKANYDYNESVGLQANANSAYRFDHWSGDLSGSENPKSLTMTGDKTVNAHFVLISSEPIHFTFTKTDESYSFVINMATLDGTQLDISDEIGIFTPAGLCVGAAVWNGTVPLAVVTWKDDAQTANIVDGYKDGETIFYRIWDASEGGNVDYPAYASYTTGDGTFGSGLYTVISIIEGQKVVQHTINLPKGWSWISTNIDPINSDIVHIFAQTLHLEILINGMGQFYIPGVINGVGNWDVLQGYKIYVNNNDQVTFTGQQIPVSTKIKLNAGWNFISYLPDQPIATEVALANILSVLEICKQDDGRFFIPGLINTMGNMEIGEGYKVYVRNAIDMKYSSNISLLKRELTDIQASQDSVNHFIFTENTGESYSIVIDEAIINEETLTVGSEIGVFSGDICVGATIWTGEVPKGLVAWADDAQTDIKDGYAVGDTMSFHIWNANDDQIYYTTADYSFGDPTFGQSIYSHIQTLQGMTITDNSSANTVLPTEFIVWKNYPNPFNPKTNITFALPEDKFVDIKIYNVQGRCVATLCQERLIAGTHQYIWRAEADASGIYLCVVRAGKNEQILKLMLIK